jgi:tetratricopeptide (TPR) repeat protein
MLRSMNDLPRLALVCALGLALGACDPRPAKGDGPTAARTLNPHRDVPAFEACLDHPDPVSYHWSREVVEAFCADVATSALEFADVRRLIETEQGAQLDAEYDAILDDYFAGRLPEGALYHAYSVFFESDESSAVLLDRWLLQSPGSAHARAARGSYRVERGWKARGEKIIRETSRDQYESMVHWIQLAKPDLEKAVELEPRIVPAYSALIQLSFMGTEHALAGRAMAAANEVDPANFYTRAAYATSLEPRWGGSVEAMDELASESEPWLTRNPRLAGVRGMALIARRERPLKEGNHMGALAEMERGLNLYPSPGNLEFAGRLAHHLRDYPHAIELYSQALRFKPRDENALVNRAQSHWAMKKYPAAKADLERLLTFEPGHLEALVTYSNLLVEEGDIPGAIVKLEAAHRTHPRELWVTGKLAWLHLYKGNSPQLAEPLIAQFLEGDPQSGGGWLMRVDVLDDLDKPGMREAAENFVRFVNTNEGWQREALPRVKRWLDENPAG